MAVWLLSPDTTPWNVTVDVGGALVTSDVGVPVDPVDGIVLRDPDDVDWLMTVTDAGALITASPVVGTFPPAVRALNVPDVSATLGYVITVDIAGVLSAVSFLAGDPWASPEELADSGTYSYDTTGYTRETDEPADTTGDSTAGTFWFSYTADASGTLTVSSDIADVIEVFDNDPFVDPVTSDPLITLMAAGDGGGPVEVNVATDATYMIRVHAVNVGSEGPGELTYAFVARTTTMTVTVQADLPFAPGAVLALVTQGTPDAEVTFNLVGYGSNPVLEEILDPTGQLLASVPIPAAAAGTHTLEAVTTEATATDDFEVLDDAPTEPSDPPTVPPAAPPTVPIQRWVLQDPKPAGTASYTFPNNPKAMSSPHPSRSITPAGTVAQSGQDLLWEGGARPHSWTFEGYAGSQEFIEALLSYVELNRRFYLIDHRRRAWEVSFENLDIDQRNDINNFWAVNYTVTAFVYSGPVLV